MACNCKSASRERKVVVKQIVKNPEKAKVTNPSKPVQKRTIRRYF